MIKRGYAVLAAVLVVMAALVPVAGASAATTCPAALVIGLHGAGEGPSSTEPSAYSKTITADFNAFSAEVKKLPNDGTSHSATLHWFKYPTVPYSDLTSVPGMVKTVGTVRTTAASLYSYVSSQAAACPGTHIAVAGYSLGSWVINFALETHYYMAGLLDLVLLQGDPCWSNTGDGSEGLAQRAQSLTTVQLGCMPAGTYPYIGFANPYTAQALCVNNDPVCGEGYNLLTTNQQLSKAIACGKSTSCPHFNYWDDGAAAYGGKWLADYIF